MPRYEVYGLTVDCEFELDLPICGRARDHLDVTIGYGSTPPANQIASNGLKYSRLDDGVVIEFNELGKYYIRNGEKIIVTPVDRDKAYLCAIPILGLVFALLLEQRGSYVLHASSVAVNDRAVIFLGSKHAGKSTLAGFFHSKGHQIITDDVAALTIQHAACIIQPGPAHIRLWPDTLDFLNETSGNLDKVHPQLEKRYLPVQPVALQCSPQVAATILLGKGHSVELTQLGKNQGLRALLKYKSGASLHRDIPPQQAAISLQLCSRIADSVPVYLLTRPENLALLELTYNQIIKALH